jgi:hypothetical protein
MPFDLELIKKHPYATGTVVIVGGVIVFYMLSSGSSSTAAASPSSDQSSAEAYDAQLAQVQAAADVQSNAQQVQLQQAQLEASVSNTQTQAQLEATQTSTAAQLAATLAQVQASTQQNQDTLAAQTIQQGNELTYASNIQSMQDSVLEDQINSGVVENANNNATGLAGVISTNDLEGTVAGYQAAVASQGVTAAQAVQQQQLSQQYNLSTQTLNMVQQAGLNHGTESLENDLVGVTGLALGTSAPATAAVTGNSSAAAASSAATASIINSITGGITKVATGLLA